MNLINKTLLFTVVSLLIAANSLFSQETPDRPYEEKGTIESQLNYVFDKSYTFEIYKSVRIAWFQRLRVNVLDTLKSIKKELRSTQKLVQTKESRLDSISSQLEKAKQELSVITKEKNSFRFLGILMSKQAYNSLLWLIILGLAALMVVFALLFKRSNFVTSQTKKDLDELKVEFEVFRKRSLEREEKMARKHLDELNKYKK